MGATRPHRFIEPGDHFRGHQNRDSFGSLHPISLKHSLPIGNDRYILNTINPHNITMSHTLIRKSLVRSVPRGVLLCTAATILVSLAGAADAQSIPANPVISSASPANAGIVDIWTANEGASLSDTLATWAQRAKWKVIWETDSDFRLAASGDFEGSFEDAAQKLIQAFGRTRPRLRATFYRGNAVLRVWAERAEP